MRRALIGIATVVGLAALYRFLFVHENKLSDRWLRDFRIADGADTFEREMDESRIVLPRTGVLDGPRIPSRYTEPVK